MAHVDCEVVIVILRTLEIIFNIALEVYIKTFTKSISKCLFNFTACTEVIEVVDKETDELNGELGESNGFVEEVVQMVR